MAIIEISNQYKYSGKGPVDSKSLVKTFNDLCATDTWTSESGANTAYNGMIVAVWLDKDATSKELTDKNGLYILFDAQVTTTLKKPDVTVPSNWHKMCELSDIQGVASQLTTLSNAIDDLADRVSAIEDKSDIVVKDTRQSFPETGEPNTLYVDLNGGKTYVWAMGTYIPVGGAEEPSIIHGGSAD